MSYDDDNPETYDDERFLVNHERLQEVLADYRHASDSEETTGSALKRRIMEIVQQESLRGPSTDLISPQGNAYKVTTSAMRAEVRRVIDGIGGLRARRVILQPVNDSAQRFDVDASLTMAPTQSLQRIVPQLRAEIARHLVDTFGIVAASIDLHVEDIYDD